MRVLQSLQIWTRSPTLAADSKAPLYTILADKAHGHEHDHAPCSVNGVHGKPYDAMEA
jgi:hypothetical protein